MRIHAHHQLDSNETNVACWLYRKSEKYYDQVYQVVFNLYGLYSVSQNLFTFPRAIDRVASAFGNMGVIDIIYVGPRFVKELTDGAIIVAAAESCTIAYLVAQVAKIAFRGFAGVFDYAYLPSQVVELYQGIEELALSENKRTAFCEQFKSPSAMHTFADRIENVRRGCTFVKNEAKTLQSMLYLSKKCKLLKHTNLFLERIAKPNADAVSDAEAFLDIIKTHIDTRRWINLAHSATIAASTVLYCTLPFFPTGPILLLLYTATTVSSLALAIFESLHSEKNPFKGIQHEMRPSTHK